MRECIEIGRWKFTTKKEAETYIRAILNRAQLDRKLQGDEFEFVLALMARNPNPGRSESAVASIAVELVPEDLSLRRFRLNRKDGSTTAFSWRKCLSPPRKIDRLKCAMRTLIRAQIVDFRNQVRNQLGIKFVCPISNEEILTDEAHVDHVTPNTFDALVSRFFSESGIDPETVKTRNLDDTWGDEIEDNGVAQAWIDFHRSNAVLRLVSRKANLSLLRKR